MTQPTLRTENLFKLTWPIFLQYATLSCVWLVDFWFFSHLSDAIAATVGQLLPVVWLGTGVIPVFAGTGVAVASQYLGARQFEKAVPAYMMNLCLTTAMGLGFGAALWFLAPDIGRWMGLDATLGGIATTYLTAMSAYFIFLGVLVAYNAVLSSRGMTNWLMYSAFVVAALNLALASLFVLGFHWGVRGVVAASVTSTAAATLLSIAMVHRGLGIRFHWRGAFRQMLGVARPMLRIGISNAVEPMSYSVQQIILSTMIIALGVHSMAANAYAGRAQMFQITFSFSLALGAQILMGHWTGARRFDDVDRLYWKIVRRATLVAFLYASTVWVFSDRVLGLFTADASIRQLGRTLVVHRGVLRAGARGEHHQRFRPQDGRRCAIPAYRRHNLHLGHSAGGVLHQPGLGADARRLLALFRGRRDHPRGHQSLALAHREMAEHGHRVAGTPNSAGRGRFHPNARLGKRGAAHRFPTGCRRSPS